MFEKWRLPYVFLRSGASGLRQRWKVRADPPSEGTNLPPSETLEQRNRRIAAIPDLHDRARAILMHAMDGKALKSGKPTYLHSLHLAQQEGLTDKQRIIALLHDVIEDTRRHSPERKWTREDLLACGFEDDIVDAVVALTIQEEPGQPKEKYFDFIRRVALAGPDAIIVKLADMTHNAQNERYAHFMSDKDSDRINRYNVCYYYLDLVKRNLLDPTTHDIVHFMRMSEVYNWHPEICNRMLDNFSSNDGRISGNPEQEVRISRFNQEYAELAQQDAFKKWRSFDPVSSCQGDDINSTSGFSIYEQLQDVQNNNRFGHFMDQDGIDLLDWTNLCFYYVAAVSRREGITHTHVKPIAPGTPIRDFAMMVPAFAEDEKRLDYLLKKFLPPQPYNHPTPGPKPA